MTGADLDAIIALDEQAAGFRRAELPTALTGVGQGLILEREGEIAPLGPSSAVSDGAM
jgi:hypothetical protein